MYNEREHIRAAAQLGLTPLHRRFGTDPSHMDELPFRQALDWGMILVAMAAFAHDQLIEVSMHVPTMDSLVDDAAEYLGFPPDTLPVTDVRT